jgi:hypothetical protein
MREGGGGGGKNFPGLGSISSSGGLGGFMSELEGEVRDTVHQRKDRARTKRSQTHTRCADSLTTCASHLLPVQGDGVVDHAPPPMPDHHRQESGAKLSAAPKKGMVLGKSSGQTNKFLDSLKAEGEIVDTAPTKGPAKGTASNKETRTALVDSISQSSTQRHTLRPWCRQHNSRAWG